MPKELDTLKNPGHTFWNIYKDYTDHAQYAKNISTVLE